MNASEPPPDDCTVMWVPDRQPEPVVPTVAITYPLLDGGRQTTPFTDTFCVGRGQDCAIRIDADEVSRQHLEISRQGERWWVRDLHSSNGTYLNDRPIEAIPLEGTIRLSLGQEGPVIEMSVVNSPVPPLPTPAPEAPLSATQLTRRYFDRTYQGPVGERTQLIRQTFQQLSRKRSRLHWTLLSVALILLIAVGGLASYQYHQLQKARELAVDIFYNMKALELKIAKLEEARDESAWASRQLEIEGYRRQLAQLQERYQSFVETIETAKPILSLRPALDNVDRIILHIANVLGECELNVPDGFADEVKVYIKRWTSTPRLAGAIQRLRDNNYAPTIYREFTTRGLPPQFLYLAMQESNFQTQIVGPRTRYGNAKGMWQFIPDTAIRYGLHVGPLRELGVYDPDDERHDAAKATAAAAKYIQTIYTTDAQASGMLVMASYNWGEGNVIRLIRQMPENPKERNFWQLLQHYRIPQETYDYVFYIFAAAVIGENPKLFGFNFDNPLQTLTMTAGAGPGGKSP